MNPFANPFSPTKRVPLIYENLKMLERECNLTKEDYGILTRFCDGERLPIVTAFLRLLYIQTVLRKVLSRTEGDVRALEEDSFAAKRQLKAIRAANPRLGRDDSDPVVVWCRMANSGESRLLLRTWKEQCDVLSRIVDALGKEGPDGH